MIIANKHVIAASIITPILAIIAYFATDYIVSEKPHQAITGSSYPLVAKSNCRYKSGKCTLSNGDMNIELIPLINNDKMNIQLKSEWPLQGIQVAITSNNAKTTPQKMKPIDNEKTQWVIQIKDKLDDDTKLRIVLSARDVLYYSEVRTDFTQYHTSFSQANMQHY